VEWYWQGKTEVPGQKAVPLLQITTWAGLGANPGLRGEAAETNRLSQGDCDCTGRDAVLAGYRRFREICCIYVNFKGFKSREVQYTELLGCWIFYMLCVFREEEGLCRPDRLSNARVRIRGRLGVGSGKEELLSFSGSADMLRPPPLNLFTCKWELGTRRNFRNVLFFSHTKQFIFAFDTTSCITSYIYVATCFDKLRGHPQPTRAHKPRITIANFI
jgi:hypothetical protein